MSQEAYSLRGMLAELVDEIIPGPAPTSIVRTYLAEALAQPGGHALLGDFIGPRTGHTVGTALVKRGHALLPYAMSGGVSMPSLLWFLFERGVQLNVPDANGNTALVSGLAGPFPANQLSFAHPRITFGAGHLNAVFPPQAHIGPSLGYYSPLVVEPSGRGLPSVEFHATTFPLVSKRIVEALSCTSRSPSKNVQWVQTVLPTATAQWTPLLHRLLAHWQNLIMETSLPPGGSIGSPRPARF